jgi:hypothetical protein
LWLLVSSVAAQVPFPSVAFGGGAERSPEMNRFRERGRGEQPECDSCEGEYFRRHLESSWHCIC